MRSRTGSASACSTASTRISSRAGWGSTLLDTHLIVRPCSYFGERRSTVVIEPFVSSRSDGVSARNYLLAFGAFGIGTSGYVVAGVLPDVAGDLHVTASTAGQLVTAYAIAYAIASPV